jgi:hypothetical protein
MSNVDCMYNASRIYLYIDLESDPSMSQVELFMKGIKKQIDAR